MNQSKNEAPFNAAKTFYFDLWVIFRFSSALIGVKFFI